MSLSVRLKQARLKKKLTQEELAEIVGIKQQAVQRIEAGKVKSTSYVVQLAQALDVTPEWLALGDESTSSSNAAATGQAFHFAPLLHWQDIELLSHLPIPHDPHKKLPLLVAASNRCFALQIKDVSMVSSQAGELSFLKNDLIIVDASRTPKAGEFVIVKLADSSQMTLRQLVMVADQPQLKALNTHYNSIAFDPDSQVCGVVIARYTNFTE